MQICSALFILSLFIRRLGIVSVPWAEIRYVHSNFVCMLTDNAFKRPDETSVVVTGPFMWAFGSAAATANFLPDISVHEQLVYILVGINKPVLTQYLRRFAQGHCGQSIVLCHHNILAAHHVYEHHVRAVPRLINRNGRAVPVIQLMACIHDHHDREAFALCNADNNLFDGARIGINQYLHSA